MDAQVFQQQMDSNRPSSTLPQTTVDFQMESSSTSASVSSPNPTPKRKQKQLVAKKHEGLTPEEIERKRLRNNELERNRQQDMAYGFRVLAAMIPQYSQTSVHKPGSRMSILENTVNHIASQAELLRDDQIRRYGYANPILESLAKFKKTKVGESDNASRRDCATIASSPQVQGHLEYPRSLSLQDVTHHVSPPSGISSKSNSDAFRRVPNLELTGPSSKRMCTQKENYYQSCRFYSPQYGNMTSYSYAEKLQQIPMHLVQTAQHSFPCQSTVSLVNKEGDHEMSTTNPVESASNQRLQCSQPSMAFPMADQTATLQETPPNFLEDASKAHKQHTPCLSRAPAFMELSTGVQQSTPPNFLKAAHSELKPVCSQSTERFPMVTQTGATTLLQNSYTPLNTASFHHGHQRSSLPTATQTVPYQVVFTPQSTNGQCHSSTPQNPCSVESATCNDVNNYTPNYCKFTPSNSTSVVQSFYRPILNPTTPHFTSTPKLSNIPQRNGSNSATATVPFHSPNQLQFDSITHSTPKPNCSSNLGPSLPNETPVQKVSEIVDSGLLKTFDKYVNSRPGVNKEMDSVVHDTPTPTRDTREEQQGTSLSSSGKFSERSSGISWSSSGYGTRSGDSLEVEVEVEVSPSIFFPEEQFYSRPQEKKENPPQRKINFDDRPDSPRLRTPPIFTEPF